MFLLVQRVKRSGFWEFLTKARLLKCGNITQEIIRNPTTNIKIGLILSGTMKKWMMTQIPALVQNLSHCGIPHPKTSEKNLVLKVRLI